LQRNKAISTAEVNDSPVIYSTKALAERGGGRFTFIDLFAGIGGFHLALKSLGGECTFSCEWDKYAAKTYYANFGEYPEGDIRLIEPEEIPQFDILTAGFPCQPFSIAGVSKKNSLGRAHGFEDETQGTLFFDIERILKFHRPKAFILENVKNLISHDKGNTFRIIKSHLQALDYTIFYKVLDAKQYVPQHRERIFIVGFDNRRFQIKEFNFPAHDTGLQHQINDILELNPDPKYTLTDRLWSYLQDYARKHKEKGNGFGYGLTNLNGIARTLSARYYKDGSEILIPQVGKNPRRLTPRECARLQGFPESFKIVVSDVQAYKQFGNAVAVPVVRAVARNVIDCIITPAVYVPSLSTEPIVI
jgi:DNA (cytosine-5)-methyltransferase 1